ncbi:hypothetical protein [Bacillus sp. REN16]|uniref:hypothetical protein n=1 Tax=Bacillus sp. REN16 TaxID=2887296 RepID=UPI001E5CBEDA|nr:hypothetical protein [Bacillus sp. REN16]MCC3359123.1 hypothetical protein [Bacillus sp. REN16]
MNEKIKTVVLSDTDILVHMVSGGIFFEVVPLVFETVYIPAKVEQELKDKHSHTYYKLLRHLNEGNLLKRTKLEWGGLSVEQKKLVNTTKTRLRARLDPGELDCYAYSLGMEIDAIISDDKGAKELISLDSEGSKVVITFWDIIILAIKMDQLDWTTGELYYNKVVQTCRLSLPPFGKQIYEFENYIGTHEWINKFLGI